MARGIDHTVAVRRLAVVEHRAEVEENLAAAARLRRGTAEEQPRTEFLRNCVALRAGGADHPGNVDRTVRSAHPGVDHLDLRAVPRGDVAAQQRLHHLDVLLHVRPLERLLAERETSGEPGAHANLHS